MLNSVSKSPKGIIRIYYRSLVQTEIISQPEGERIMPETRFTEFPALSVDPRVGISWSASETDILLFFLPITLKIIKFHSSVLLVLLLEILLCITTFNALHSVFFMVANK